MTEFSHRAAVGNIVARLERLPTSWWQVKTRIIVGVATFFDAFDALAIASVLPVIAPLWKLAPAQIGFMISAGFLGQLIGALLFGWVAEQDGRRTAMISSIALFGVMSLVCAFAWDYNSLLVFRFIQGIGLGGEVPVAAVFISELAKARGRGRFVLLYELVFPVGLVAVALVGVWVVPHLGWQYIFVIGALPALLALALRWLVPESPRWLAVCGRVAEAEAAMALIEAKVQMGTGQALSALKPIIPPATASVGAEAQDAQVAKPSVSYKFRLARLPYVISSLFLWVVFLAAFVIVANGAVASGVQNLLVLVLVACNFILVVGRFHDIGSSGWWSLLLFVPIVGFGVWLFLFLTRTAWARSAQDAERASLSDLFGRLYLRRTLVVWVIWFAAYFVNYGLSVWLPTIYRAVFELPLDQSLRYGLITQIVGLVGTTICALAIDHVGRRPWFALSFVGATLALWALALYPAPSAGQVLACVSVAYFFVSTINIGVYLYTPELYPTRVRAFGVGTATAWLRFASMIGPIVVGLMIGPRLTPAEVSGVPRVFLAFGAVAALAAIITGLFALETKGRVLEEVSP